MTARRLSEDLEVSERTIYRDMADLIGSGVPVEGEAGVGYLMRSGCPPPKTDPQRCDCQSCKENGLDVYQIRN